MEKKNVCQHCGGLLVIEYISSYGSVYALKRNGEPSRRRLKKTMYEENGGDYMIYCKECGREAKRV